MSLHFETVPRSLHQPPALPSPDLGWVAQAEFNDDTLIDNRPSVGTPSQGNTGLAGPPLEFESEAPEIESGPTHAVDLATAVDDPQSGPTEGDKAGEAGAASVSNTDFIAQVFRTVPKDAFVAVCSKAGDPDKGGWIARRADRFAAQLADTDNNYLNCSSFYPSQDGTFRARKDNFAGCQFLLIDDLGTKVPPERLARTLSWKIETSLGNFQGGIILAEPITDSFAATRLLNAIIDKGLCDPGATGPASRWARLPVAINGKPKHADDAGAPFQCRLVEWHPERRSTEHEVVEQLELELAPATRPKPTHKRAEAANRNVDEVLSPKAAENPVVVALKARGLYKTSLGSGKHDVTCPWVDQHTDALDSGAAYFEPDDQYPAGGFRCQHSHGEQFRLKELLSFLGVTRADATHRPVIRLVSGALAKVVDAAEKVLAERGRHFEAGGLIVSVRIDPVTGDPSIVPTNRDALARELSEAARWEKFDGTAKDWVPADPPERYVGTLYNGQKFDHLPTLAGIARQPYFREADGALVMQPGYDPVSRRFAVFDPRRYADLPEPTIDAARAALMDLEDVLREFRFVAPADRAAALAAIFTAAVRPSLPYAPGFHFHAPVSGSGKSYLGELCCLFAGPAANTKVSYPTTSEEATKAILALLLASPAVIEFDDMTTDWIPHGVINRMFTSEGITDRVLGVSKTATVGTRVLVLGSGNNVGPVRDLRRRVLTIHLDPRVAVPAMIEYQGSPVEHVRQNRDRYVGLVLTIIRAWRQAGSPRAKLASIATFNGPWTDLCRHPLVWLGHPDPATTLIAQVSHDPDTDALLGLMAAWHAALGSTPTTIRDALVAALDDVDLRDALHDCPVDDRGAINRNKLGWFLKKNVNRIVGGFEFQRTEGGGRTAWRVEVVKAPASPASPPLLSSKPTIDMSDFDADSLDDDIPY